MGKTPRRPRACLTHLQGPGRAWGAEVKEGKWLAQKESLCGHEGVRKGREVHWRGNGRTFEKVHRVVKEQIKESGDEAKRDRDRTQTGTVPGAPELAPEPPGIKNWGRDAESLHCTPEASVTLYVNYTGIKKKKKKN